MPPEVDRRTRHYLIFRLLVILLGFGLIRFYQVSLGGAFRQNTFAYLYSLLALYLAIGVALLVSHSRWHGRREIVRGQVLVDFGLQSLLIWGTGGVLSIFSPLLFVTLVSATTLITARGAFALATAAVVLLTGTTVAYSLGFAPTKAPDSVESLLGGTKPVFMASYLIGSVLALYTISALGSRLSHGLRSVQGIHSEILENMAEGLIAFDKDGRVIQLNKEARNLLGLSKSDLGGSRVAVDDLFPLDHHAALRKALSEGGRRRLETQIQIGNGLGRPVEVKISSVQGDFGEPRCQIALLSDLTLKKEVEKAERRIQKLEDLQVMSLGIAHEIRNPLASIRGCVQEIGRLTHEDSTVAQYMEIACRESDRLDGVLESFLLYARSGPLDLACLDLCEVIDEAVMLLRSRPDLGTRAIIWSPPPARPKILGDRNRLIQVLLNLGINAIEATSLEGGRISIALHSKLFARVGGREGTQEPVPGVEVQVADNGKGMSREGMKRAFTPFFTTKPKGNGLGLCIVDRIIREHGGVTDVSSSEDAGTILHLWFPVIENSRAMPAMAEQLSPQEVGC